MRAFGGDITSVAGVRPVSTGFGHGSRTISPMISPRTFRIALVVVTALGQSAVGTAQQTPKRQTTKTAAEKSPAEKPDSKADAKPPAKKTGTGVKQVDGSDAAPKRQPRPQTQELKIKPLPEELEQLLKDWERESAKIEKLSGKHKRIVYNKVFEVEKIAEGQFYYEAPDKGRIDLVGIEPKKDEQSQRVNEKTGKPYRLEKEQQSKWICTGKEVLSINEDAKEFEAFPLPPELQGTNIIHGPLPFLFGMKAEEAKKRFALSFADEDDPKKNNEKVVWLIAKPRQVMDRDNFQEATIILDRERFLPLAVKLIDPSGNLETVYTFSKKELHVNAKEALVPSIFRNKPFHPNLRGYKAIVPKVVQPEDQKSDAREGNGRPKNTVRQTNNTDDAPAAGTAKLKTAGSGRPKK
jgi:TIGR03009 family protein